METDKLKNESKRIHTELQFEKDHRRKIHDSDIMHYNELRRMEEANEYWRAKYGTLENERD